MWSSLSLNKLFNWQKNQLSCIRKLPYYACALTVIFNSNFRSIERTVYHSILSFQDVEFWNVLTATKVFCGLSGFQWCSNWTVPFMAPPQPWPRKDLFTALCFSFFFIHFPCMLFSALPLKQFITISKVVQSNLAVAMV